MQCASCSGVMMVLDMSCSCNHGVSTEVILYKHKHMYTHVRIFTYTYIYVHTHEVYTSCVRRYMNNHMHRALLHYRKEREIKREKMVINKLIKK